MSNFFKLRWLFLPLFLVACGDGSPGVSSDEGCGEQGPCPAGSVCIDDECKKICSSDSHCASSGTICVESICVAGERTDLPMITSIDGDSAQDFDSTHTGHHIHRILTVNGRNLDGVSARLVDENSNAHELEVCEPGTDQIKVALPDSTSEEIYTLSVATQAGACDAVLPVLQGDTGPQGPQGPSGESLEFPSGLCAFSIIRSTCPSGWSRASALDNRVIRGVDSGVGGTGGDTQHTHEVTSNVQVSDHNITWPGYSFNKNSMNSNQSSHSHNLATGSSAGAYAIDTTKPILKHTNGLMFSSSAGGSAGQTYVRADTESDTISWSSSTVSTSRGGGSISSHSITNGTVSTGNASNSLPPYLNALICCRD